MPGALSGRDGRGGLLNRRRGTLAVAAAVLVCLGGPAAGGKRAPETQPAPGPVVFTVPAASQPATGEIPKAATVEEALAYDRSERTILDDVRDRDGQLDSPGLYVLLRRAAMLPEGPETLREADRPNVKNFWREPERYRGKLVVVEGLFAKKQDWSADATPTPRWSTRGVYMVYLRELATGEGRPVIVMLTRPPPDYIPPGRRLRIAGLFYKLVTLPEDERTGGDAERTHEHPVIVACSIYTRASSPAAAMPRGVYLMFGLIILLLVAFMLIRRRSMRQREGLASKYRPRRFEQAADRPETGAPAADDEQVDEDLVREVRAFRDERPPEARAKDGDDQEDPG